MDPAWRTLAIGSAMLSLMMAFRPAVGHATVPDVRKWNMNAYGGQTSLWYGTPESDDIVIAFECDDATKQLAIGFSLVPSFHKAGNVVSFSLSSEAGGLTFEGTVGEQSMIDDMFPVTATTTLTPALQQLIARGTQLTLLVEDGTIDVPLDGAAEAGLPLFAICGRADESW